MAAGATVVVIVVCVYTGPIATHLTGRTWGQLTAPIHAGLTRRTDVAAGATIVEVGVRVQTGSVASRLSRRTLLLTHPVHTTCAILADIAAGATIVGVSVRVHAVPTAVPFTQLVPFWQTLPQEPQLWESVFVFMQVLPQRTVPDGQIPADEGAPVEVGAGVTPVGV